MVDIKKQGAIDNTDSESLLIDRADARTVDAQFRSAYA